jgi:hypothetical protein
VQRLFCHAAFLLSNIVHSVRNFVTSAGGVVLQ